MNIFRQSHGQKKINILSLEKQPWKDLKIFKKFKVIVGIKPMSLDLYVILAIFLYSYIPNSSPSEYKHSNWRLRYRAFSPIRTLARSGSMGQSFDQETFWGSSTAATSQDLALSSDP